MGQYEPRDSRDVTNKPGDEPGDIQRTGPREGETRRPNDADKSEAGEEPVETPPTTSWEGERSKGTEDPGRRW